ncbi:MAG: hypothetical protein ACRECV_13490 [Xanthobacteraceae bacterium]
MLAIRGRKRLKLAFGIRRKRDPLRVSASSLVVQPTMARLLGCVCQIIAPFPTMHDADDYRVIYTAPGDGKWPDLYSTLFRYVRRRVQKELKKRVRQADREDPDKVPNDLQRAARTAVRISGLLDYRDGSDEECGRFIQRFITCHRQIATLQGVGGALTDTLKQVDFSGTTKIAVPGFDGCRIGWKDYHNIGRWRDAWRARLQLGLVDSGRDIKLRYRLPEQVRWRWPREAPISWPIERLVRPLISTARFAMKGDRGLKRRKGRKRRRRIHGR